MSWFTAWWSSGKQTLKSIKFKKVLFSVLLACWTNSPCKYSHLILLNQKVEGSGKNSCPFQRQLDITLAYSQQEITSSVLLSAHVNITERCFSDSQTTLPFSLGLPNRDISKPTPSSKKSAYLVFCKETSGVEITSQLWPPKLGIYICEVGVEAPSIFSGGQGFMYFLKQRCLGTPYKVQDSCLALADMA